MKEKPRQPVNATIPEQKSQTKTIEQPQQADSNFQNVIEKL